MNKNIKYYWNSIVMLFGSILYVIIFSSNDFGLFLVMFFPWMWGISFGAIIAFCQLVYGLLRYFWLSKGEKRYLHHCGAFAAWALGFAITVIGVFNGYVLTV